MAGAPDAQAVQVGGPSGNCISRQGFAQKARLHRPSDGRLHHRLRSADGTSSRSSATSWNSSSRSPAAGARPAGRATPSCSASSRRSRAERARPGTSQEIESWGKIIKATSRCGLGQTSPNPILTTLQNFREHLRGPGPEGRGLHPRVRSGRVHGGRVPGRGTETRLRGDLP